MRVIHCDASHREAWDAFVDTAPRASFYHRFAWKDVNEQVLGRRSTYLAAMDGSTIVGIFPFVHLRSRLFGNIACSMPFVNYGGVCTENADAEVLLLDEATRVCREAGVEYLEIRARALVGPELPTADHKVSMSIDLDPDPEVLFKGFKTGHRQDIRRAYKNGLTWKAGGMELLDAFYDVLSESWRDLGTPIYQKAYFEAILRTFPESTRLGVVLDANGTAIAAALDGMHGSTVEGMWLGTKSEYRRQLVGYVLYWELIKDACERKYARFHLGRSTVDSSGETFKKKWNASTTQLYWQYVLLKRPDVPQLNVSNPKYQFAINLWRRLPVSVTQSLGPFLARSIP
jgi:FemAB-related protein (PEP-CTERM system-associated)